MKSVDIAGSKYRFFGARQLVGDKFTALLCYSVAWACFAFRICVCAFLEKFNAGKIPFVELFSISGDIPD